MYQPLVVCTECRRHLRATEAACPFCRTDRVVAPIERVATKRMSRAAAVAVAASLAAACQSEPAPIARDPVAAKPSVTAPPAPVAPPADAGLVDDPGTMIAKYGAPPPPHPDPLAVPAYGAPPPKP